LQLGTLIYAQKRRNDAHTFLCRTGYHTWDIRHCKCKPERKKKNTWSTSAQAHNTSYLRDSHTTTISGTCNLLSHELRVVPSNSIWQCSINSPFSTPGYALCALPGEQKRLQFPVSDSVPRTNAPLLLLVTLRAE